MSSPTESCEYLFGAVHELARPFLQEELYIGWKGRSRSSTTGFLIRKSMTAAVGFPSLYTPLEGQGDLVSSVTLG